MNLLKKMFTMKETKADQAQPDQSIIQNLSQFSEQQLDELADYLEKRQKEKEKQKQEDARKAEAARREEADRKAEEARLKKIEEAKGPPTPKDEIGLLFEDLFAYRNHLPQCHLVYVVEAHKRWKRGLEMGMGSHLNFFTQDGLYKIRNWLRENNYQKTNKI